MNNLNSVKTLTFNNQSVFEVKRPGTSANARDPEVVERYQAYDLSEQEIAKIQYLHRVKDKHPIWKNKLLLASQEGLLTRTDYQYLFSQYYLYSKNFTKLISAGMVNCDSDYFRSKLSENLWEEGGGQEVELRHAEIFRRFLINTLQINLADIHFEAYTQLFFDRYLQLCLQSSSAECAAILSFGTEAIVARLYSMLKIGMLKAGITDEQLEFFNIHIACDDDHALTLEEMTLSYRAEERWLERCESAINKSLDLRDTFFTHVYYALRAKPFEMLVNNISERVINGQAKVPVKVLTVNDDQNRLYENKQIEEQINFIVQRLDFNADVLDPRVVTIPCGFHNEVHRHAHETIFLILAGTGVVQIDDQTLPVKSGDVVYVPRWSSHHARNIGDELFKYFAITDYGLTKRIPQNTETVYRLNK